MLPRLFSLLCLAACCTVGLDLSTALAVPLELERWLGEQKWDKDTDAPIVSLGQEGKFDDMHIFAPAVANDGERFLMWYCGSRGTRTERVFRLGLATSDDGKTFERHAGDPVYEFSDGVTSVLTPTVLRNPDGTTLREEGKLRMWHTGANFKVGLHTLHEATSEDGITWTEPSAPLLEHCYCPSVLKTERGYEMWYADVSKRPWVIRYAQSDDGTHWNARPESVLGLSQPWEAEILVYPTVVQVDGVYLMWYGSYYSAVRRQTTAIGFAASMDGEHWHKHPQNPVIVPDPERLWESNYVGSGCVMQLPDKSFRYWYASRTKPPFEHLYFAINTARWGGPVEPQVPPLIKGGDINAIMHNLLVRGKPLDLPPTKGNYGTLKSRAHSVAHAGPEIDVLEIIDAENAIVRAWYEPSDDRTGRNSGGGEVTFVDVWVHGVETQQWQVDDSVKLPHLFHAVGNHVLATDCGGRSFPRLDVTNIESLPKFELLGSPD